VLWSLLYTGAFALVLQHRVLTPLRNATRHRMRVAAAVPEGAGVFSVVVEGTNLHELQAQSGQFFRWRFLTPDLWATAHPFSLSAAPTNTHLRLTVKTLGDGRATLQRLEAGTWVQRAAHRRRRRVDGPLLKFG
jgi:predicted ferric reductase